MYGGVPYAGGPYAGGLMDEGDIPSDHVIHTAVEVAFTTAPLSPSPAFVDIGGDCRWWDSLRGRSGELERFPAGRATVVLDNLERQYDSVNVDGPWFGYLKPNRRIRIRETVDGVTYTQFDGYVDRWQLDYPGVGKDATATVTATDLSKLLARVDMPLSVYDDVVLDDAPEIYWRFDEQKNSEADAALVALNRGTLGPTGDAAYVGPPELGGEALVVNDPGSSMYVTSSAISPGTEDMGAIIQAAQFALLPAPDAGFVFECWCIPQAEPGANATIFALYNGGGTVEAHAYYTLSNTFVLNTFPTGSSPTVSSGPAVDLTHKRYHVVFKVIPGETVKLWLNGVLHDDGQVAVGLWDTPGPLRIGHLTGSPSLNWVGQLSHMAIWRGAAAAAFGDSHVQAHYAAGTHPWQGDDGDDRIGRVLDMAGVPVELRYLDDGEVTFQSAEVDGQTALEHVQKVGETEFPQVFITRDGKVRFLNKTSILGRAPSWVFSDDGSGVGYRDLVPDDGDGSVRNKVTISRLNGMAKTATDAASIEENGRLDYVLEGLLHDSEGYSQAYADFVAIEYAEPRRRISTIEVGPPIVGEEAAMWPAILGPELLEAVTVTHTPPGGGDPFEQVCVIEEIHHTSVPGGERSVRFGLSPEFPVRELEGEEVATLGYASHLGAQAGISAEVDVTGCSVAVVVGAGRRIRVTGHAQADNDANAGTPLGFIYEDGVSVGRWMSETVVASGFSLADASVILTPSAGAHTYKLRASKFGTGTFNFSAAEIKSILVEDIGPV